MTSDTIYVNQYLITLQIQCQNPKKDNAKKRPPTINYGALEFDSKQNVSVYMDVFNSQPANFDVSWATSTIKYAPVFMRSIRQGT